MNNTPRTDAVYDSLHGMGNVKVEFARQLERELNAALVCAGVASLERGEWAVERAAIATMNPALALIREAIFNELDRHEWDFSLDEDRVDFADRVIAWVSKEPVAQTTPKTIPIAIATRLQEWSINPSLTDALLVKEIREGADAIAVLVDALIDIERDANYGSVRDDLFIQILKKARAALVAQGRLVAHVERET